MPNKLLNAITVKDISQDAAEMHIHGTIIDDSYNSWFWSDDDKAGYVLPTDVKKQLKALNGKDLTVYINSDGGQVNAGIAIANMLARHTGNTTAVIDGWAASIASVIFMACDRRKMPSNTWLMIHKPALQIAGNANDLRHAVSFLDTIQEGIEQTYQERAKRATSAEDIHAMVEAETWLTAEEAAEKFEIEIIDAQMEAAACAGSISDAFRKVPKDLLRSPIFQPGNKKRPTNAPTASNTPSDLARKKAFILKSLAESK